MQILYCVSHQGSPISGERASPISWRPEWDKLADTSLSKEYSFLPDCLWTRKAFTWGFPYSSVGKKIRLQCRRPQFDFWVSKTCWRRDRLPIPVFLGFPCGSAGKESTCNVGDLGLIPGLGRSLGEGKGYPLPYSGPATFTSLHTIGSPASAACPLAHRSWDLEASMIT